MAVNMTVVNNLANAIKELLLESEKRNIEANRLNFLRLVDIGTLKRKCCLFTKFAWDSGKVWFNITVFEAPNVSHSVTDLDEDSISVYLDGYKLDDNYFTINNGLSDSRGNYRINFGSMIPQGTHTVFLYVIDPDTGFDGFSEKINIQL